MADLIISKKLTQVLYVGAAPLTLSALPSGVRAAIKLIRQVNSGGTGYVSFNPASGVNSLTTAPAKTDTSVAQFIIETISSTPSVNLGPDWALGIAASASRLLLTVVANQTAQNNTFTVASGDEGSYLIESTTGLASPAYAKNGTAVTTLSTMVPVVLAIGDTFSLTSTTNGTLTLIKQ